MHRATQILLQAEMAALAGVAAVDQHQAPEVMAELVVVVAGHIRPASAALVGSVAVVAVDQRAAEMAELLAAAVALMAVEPLALAVLAL